MTGAALVPLSGTEVRKGEAEMADNEMAAMGAAEPADADGCFARGMMYSAGAGVAVDLIEAHKWFNIAAMRGHGDAARLRREIAEQMSDAEIGCAQRAARGWLKAHPQEPAARKIRAAA
jgi:TPR repeat protein